MRAFVFRLTPVCLAISSAFGGLSVAEAEEEKTLTLSPVVVTATRQAQNSFDLPIAIDVVTEKDIKDGQLQMQLSESLIRIPGITAQNRTQQAQDPQISSRGFGSRSSFGVRGVRVWCLHGHGHGVCVWWMRVVHACMHMHHASAMRTARRSSDVRIAERSAA